MKKVPEKKKRNLTKIIRIIAIALLILFIFRGIAVLVLLIALSLSMSYFVNALKLRNIGIELVTFTGVLAGLKFGPWVGLILTFILISYHMITGTFFGIYLVWVIPAYCIAAVISGFLPQMNIVSLGIYITIGINMNNLFFTFLSNPSYVPKYLTFVLTNILFNILIFSLLGPIVVLVM